jgi:hypothetical protein
MNNVGIVKNILTFGASARVENTIEEFKEMCNDCQKLYEQMEEKKAELNKKLEQLIMEKTLAVKSLKKINKISKNLKSKNRQMLNQVYDGEVVSINFDSISETISSGEVAMNATKGMATGVSSALGTWALVSTLGTASTGTAIGTLSGAAATNATLAWLGGGALAAGGGGVAAGTAVLGGLVAIPALVVAGVFSHLKANKQIKEIEEKMLSVIKDKDNILSNITAMKGLYEHSDELIVSLSKSRTVFEHELVQVYKSIYPKGVFSKWFKWIRKNILRKRYFSEGDLEHVQYIGSIATDFSVLIDTKIM